MTDYITFKAAGQLFGLPIERVQDVFAVANLTRVPLAAPEIAGVLNLRGRIVTIVDLVNRLKLKSAKAAARHLAIGMEVGAESFGVLVDSMAEVLGLPDGERERPPINLDRELAGASAGVFRLERELLVILDADRIVDIHGRAAAA
jgi:purine-binding chemotaxis protein CheW